MHKWCDMAESDGGIAILNDGKYGVGVDENHITLSLLRATIRPDIISDMGKHDFVYRIVPSCRKPSGCRDQPQGV